MRQIRCCQSHCTWQENSRAELCRCSENTFRPIGITPGELLKQRKELCMPARLSH